MDSVDMWTEQSLRTFIKDVLNEIIESAIEKARTAIENNTATDKDTVADEVKLIKEQTMIEEQTVIEKEFEIEEPDSDSVVETIVEELVLSVCQLSTDGGDEAEDSSAPTPVAVDMINTDKKSVVDEDGVKCDSVEKKVGDQVSQPVEGADDKNAFGDVVGRIDAEVIPAAKHLAPHKLKNRLAAAWCGIKRFLLCGCCVPRGK